MNRRLTLAIAALVCAAAAPALGQPATSVQLPTFSHFGVGTTVSVPDRGAAYLGGVNRAAGDLRQFGAPLLPFGNRSMGASRGASGMSVSVWVHDFEAMDEALLRQGKGDAALFRHEKELRPLFPPARRPDAWEQALARPAPAEHSVPSVEDLQRQRLAAQETRAAEAADFFARAEKAESEGKANVAKIYYQMAARRATGDLQARAQSRLEALRAPGAAVAASGR